VQAVPSQDRLNKILADEDLASEFIALMQRYATGIDIPPDPTTGKPDTRYVEAFRKMSYDRIMVFADPNAQIHTSPGADISYFDTRKNDARMSIARNTGTPLHYLLLTGDPPSGRALKALEARFTKKVRDRQALFGNVWEDALHFALVIVGDAQPDDGVQLRRAGGRERERRNRRDHGAGGRAVPGAHEIYGLYRRGDRGDGRATRRHWFAATHSLRLYKLKHVCYTRRQSR
jgi:hypothetical protein